MSYGICKLTGQSGKLVRSHLLPKAVTRSPTNEPRVDGYDGNRPTRRFDSWFDTNIVTRAGEDVLSKYDDWAIKELRRLKLIWSSWAGESSLPINDVEISPGAIVGSRRLECRDASAMRLFYLSLLWRAAVTNLPGYGVSISQENTEKLRLMLVSGTSEPFTLFPVVLTQLVTIGPWHNAGPRRMLLSSDGLQRGDEPFIRFYFEGLIAHVYEDDSGLVASKLGNLAVGNDGHITVITRPYEGSAQQEWLDGVLITNLRDHAETVERIFGRGHG